MNKYCPVDGLGVDGLTCYHLRCGVLHSGNAAKNAHLNMDAVIFSVPETAGQIHAVTFQIDGQTALSIALEEFLASMFQGVERWHGDHGNDEIVRRNLTHLLTWHPYGIAPFVIGSPLIGSYISEIAASQN